MADLTDDQVIDQVEAEFRPGGRPLAIYLHLGVVDRPLLLGQVLTTRIIRNLEDRIVAIEDALGLRDDPVPDDRGQGYA